MSSWQPTSNPTLTVDDYLRIVDPASRNSYRMEPHQDSDTHDVNFHAQGYEPQPTSIPRGYYSAVQGPASPSQMSHASARSDQDFFPDEEDRAESSMIDSVNAQQKTRKAKARDVASMQDGWPRSKRAERRAKIVEEHGSVSATDNPKGKTRDRNGVKEWFDPNRGVWLLAAPLDDYRRFIIDEDNARDSYDYPPDHGQHEDDVTTFPLTDNIGQKHWHFHNRRSLGNILDTEGNQVMYLLKKPNTDTETPRPGFMMYGNVIMLDPDDWPILDWPDVPRCISSQIEGWRIEALRRVFPWLALPQFRARMPRQVHKRSVGIKPLFGLSSLTQRVCRFREVYDIPPWKKSKGVDLTQYTQARIAEEGLEPDSTAGLEPVSRREVLHRKEPHKGKFPENVGIYGPAKEQRIEKERRETRQNQMYTSAPGTKRKRDENEAPDVTVPYTPKRRRSPSGAAIKPRPRHTPPGVSSTEDVVPTNPMVGAQYKSSQPKQNPHASPNIPNFDSRETNSARQVELNTTRPNHVSRSSSMDLRQVAPRTISDQVCIKAALSFTIMDYRFWYGEEPPITTNTASYQSQYQEIQTHHRKRWGSRSQAPQLIGLPGWFGSSNSIPVPDIEEGFLQRLLPAHGNSPPATLEMNTPQSFESIDAAFDQLIASSSYPPSVPPPTPTSGEGSSRVAQQLPTPFPSDLFDGNDAGWGNDDDIDFSAFQQGPFHVTRPRNL